MVHRICDEQIAVGVEGVAQLLHGGELGGGQRPGNARCGQHGEAVAHSPAGVLGTHRKLSAEGVDTGRIPDDVLEHASDDLRQVLSGTDRGGDAIGAPSEP